MKCVILIDQALPLGLIANASAVLAMSIGNKVKNIIGEDVRDKDGTVHRGITHVAIPVLKGDEERIRSMRDGLLQMRDEDLFFVDFCDVAQQSRDYEQYANTLKQTASDELKYLGIAIYGPKKKVNSLTGNAALFA